MRNYFAELFVETASIGKSLPLLSKGSLLGAFGSNGSESWADQFNEIDAWAGKLESIRSDPDAKQEFDRLMNVAKDELIESGISGFVVKKLRIRSFLNA